MNTINKNYTTNQKSVSGDGPTRIKTVNNEGGEDVTEVVMKRYAEHVKMIASTNEGREDVKKGSHHQCRQFCYCYFVMWRRYKKDIITKADSVNNKPAAVVTSKAEAGINIEAPGPRAKEILWFHPEKRRNHPRRDALVGRDQWEDPSSTKSRERETLAGQAISRGKQS